MNCKQCLHQESLGGSDAARGHVYYVDRRTTGGGLEDRESNRSRSNSGRFQIMICFAAGGS